MSKETTNAGRIGDLSRFHAALSANAPDLAHLEGPRTRLERILTDVQEVFKQQAALIASKQDASRRLKTLVTEGQRVANGLRKLVTEHYGLRSEKLAEFGLQPFRGRPRKAKPEEPGSSGSPPPVTPAAVPVGPIDPDR